MGPPDVCIVNVCGLVFAIIARPAKSKDAVKVNNPKTAVTGKKSNTAVGNRITEEMVKESWLSIRRL